MFGLSMHNCRTWSIGSFREALAFYEACPTRRGTEYGDERRILGKETSQQMGVRISKGSVKFRYHRTDVVTWNKDDSVAIETFPSRSTCEFANRFLHPDTYLGGQGSAVTYMGRCYPIIDTIKLHKSGGVDHGERPCVFAKRRTCRKGAKAALESTRFSEYREWYKLMSPMLGDIKPTYDWWDFSIVLSRLASKEHWHELMLSNCGAPESLRGIIYEQRYSEGVPVYYDEVANYLLQGVDIAKWRVEPR